MAKDNDFMALLKLYISIDCSFAIDFDNAGSGADRVNDRACATILKSL
jgi:hypothetical protein